MAGRNPNEQVYFTQKLPGYFYIIVNVYFFFIGTNWNTTFQGILSCVQATAAMLIVAFTLSTNIA